MSELLVTNQNPLLLSSRVNGESLEVLYEGQPLPAGGVKLVLDDGTSMAIHIADFVQENICYRANASTVSNGMLDQWAREESGVRSPALMAAVDTEQRFQVQVQAVAYDEENASARERADYTAGPIYNNTIDVWIPKKDSKPT